MDNLNSVQSIMDALAEMAARKQVISPQTFMDAAGKINALLQGEQEKLYTLEHELSKLRTEIMEQGKTASFAKQAVESNPLWLECRKQSILIERAKETVLLAKKNATLASELMRHSL